MRKLWKALKELFTPDQSYRRLTYKGEWSFHNGGEKIVSYNFDTRVITVYQSPNDNLIIVGDFKDRAASK